MQYLAFHARLVAGVIVVVTSGASAATDFKGPLISPVRPDWSAATVELANSGISDIVQLNAASAERFTNIAASPVPVLLPFDVAGYNRNRNGENAKPITDYLHGLTPTGFFLAGPAGYDAAFSLRTSSAPGLSDIKFADPVLVTVSGFAFVYDLPTPAGIVERPSRELEAEFPGVRRQILEHTLRFSFERYGVPYVISIQCFDAAQRHKRLACKNADRVATLVLRELRVAGGTPKQSGETIAAPAIERPKQASDVFTYHPAGRLLAGTGMKGTSGDPDAIVYSNIRFPIAGAPAYINSQSFMHGGDCDQTGRRSIPRTEEASYRCRVNSKPLAGNEAAAENYAYPWRDNFCEHRHYYVGRCPSGLGHQGEDIRPSFFCNARGTGPGGCQTAQNDVVAARDGMILREAWHEAFFLYVNSANERLRFRYLHMSPQRLDEEKMVSGRVMREGEYIGPVGNYNRREGGTSYHLHFELHIPTRDGWVRVNPYMTLVAAYERLIHARGVEITEPENEPVEMAQSEPTPRKGAKKGKAKGKRVASKGRKAKGKKTKS